MQPHAHGTVITTDNILAPLIPTIFLPLCINLSFNLKVVIMMSLYCIIYNNYMHVQAVVTLCFFLSGMPWYEANSPYPHDFHHVLTW